MCFFCELCASFVSLVVNILTTMGTRIFTKNTRENVRILAFGSIKSLLKSKIFKKTGLERTLLV